MILTHRSLKHHIKESPIAFTAVAGLTFLKFDMYYNKISKHVECIGCKLGVRVVQKTGCGVLDC